MTNREPQLIKIGEVARRAGVNRGTVTYYTNLGLLPKPAKTFRNMAYYDPACVERIREIKELQEKSFLPLHEIRRIVAGRGGVAVKAAVEAQQAALEAISNKTENAELTLEEAAKAFDLPKRLIEELVRIDFIGFGRHRNSDQLVFFGPDLEVLAAVAELKRKGITERAGFKPRDLLMYKNAMEALLGEELALFLRVVVGRRSPEEAKRLARAAIDGATSLLVAMRKRVLSGMLAAAAPEKIQRLASGK